MVIQADRLVVARAAPRSSRQQLPFAVWIALAKATPVAGLDDDAQGLLGECAPQESAGNKAADEAGG